MRTHGACRKCVPRVRVGCRKPKRGHLAGSWILFVWPRTSSSQGWKMATKSTQQAAKLNGQPCRSATPTLDSSVKNSFCALPARQARLMERATVPRAAVPNGVVAYAGLRLPTHYVTTIVNATVPELCLLGRCHTSPPSLTNPTRPFTHTRRGRHSWMRTGEQGQCRKSGSGWETSRKAGWASPRRLKCCPVKILAGPGDASVDRKPKDGHHCRVR